MSQCGCPGSQAMDFRKDKNGDEGATGTVASQLRQWPVQLHLVNPMAPYYQGADVLLTADCVAYAQKHGIPVPVTQEKPYSSDRNLLHISFEGGILEDPWAEPPAAMFALTKSPEAAPATPITRLVLLTRPSVTVRWTPLAAL